MRRVLLRALICAAALSLLSPASFADVTLEAPPITIKGNRIFAFSSRSMEGSKEAFLPGISREESLRFNISGKADDTEIDANFFSSSVMGVTQVSSREDSISVLLKRGDTEVYLGDFRPLMDGLEFSAIDKMVSGLRVEGNYENWGFMAVAASPKGVSRLKRMYGDNSQGPYPLNDSPVVVDSDRVYVDGARQTRGRDYEIDYQAGTITFKNRTIRNISVIEAAYDLKETSYQHSTYALRGKFSPFPSLMLGATYIDDSDLMNNAGAVHSSSGVEPASHFIIGGDGAFLHGDTLSLKGEAAYSVKREKMLTDPGSALAGKALKLDLGSSVGPLNLAGKYKRVGANFFPVGEAPPKQNVDDLALNLSFNPDPLFSLDAGAADSKYSRSGARYSSSDRTGRARIRPPKLPSVEYTVSDLVESTDPVTSLPIDRLINRNALELQAAHGVMRASLKGGRESRLVRSPSEETTVYRTVNAGLSLVPGSPVQASANMELKESDLPFDRKGGAKSIDLHLSASPAKEYMASGSLNYTDDTDEGITQVTDLVFRAEPLSQVRTSGKYTVSSLKELFGSTGEAVRKDEGSFSIELRPVERIRMRYFFKPMSTTLAKTLGTTYSNLSQQAEASFFVLSETMLGYSVQKNSGFTVDKNDFPLYRRRQNSQDSTTTIYSLKTAPLRFLSCEFDLTEGDAAGRTLVSTAEYRQDNSRKRRFDARIRSSLSETFAVDGGYNYAAESSGTGESPSNTGDTIAHTGNIKLIYNINPALSVNASYGYSQSTNYILPSDRDTHTIQPGAGFILTLAGALRIDGNYSYSRSFLASSAEKSMVSLRARYDLMSFLHVTARYDTETSRSPDYRTSEFSGTVEINL